MKLHVWLLGRVSRSVAVACTGSQAKLTGRGAASCSRHSMAGASVSAS